MRSLLKRVGINHKVSQIMIEIKNLNTVEGGPVATVALIIDSS